MRALNTLAASVALTVASVTFANACETTRVDCIPKPDPGVNYQSTPGYVDNREYIPVLVCHTWWAKLWGNPAQNTRWWGPTKFFARTGWSADLDASYQECKWFWVVPGEEITTEVSCFDDAIATTGPITATIKGTKVYLHLK